MLKRRHLSAGALEALRDGEGPFWSRALAHCHLALCAACRRRRVAERAESDRAAALLRVAMLPAGGDRWPDISDAWERFLIQSGAGAAFARRQITRRNVIGAALIAAGLTGVSIAIGRMPHGISPSDLVTRMYSLSAQDRLSPKGPTQRDVELARSIATLEARGQLHRLSDVCCADRDGEGPADDGVLTVRLEGSRSPVVILYEDTQRAGTFKPGDAVLMVSRPGLSVEKPSAGANGLPPELRE